jgi:hypothetical protein
MGWSPEGLQGGSVWLREYGVASIFCIFDISEKSLVGCAADEFGRP